MFRTLKNLRKSTKLGTNYLKAHERYEKRNIHSNIYSYYEPDRLHWINIISKIITIKVYIMLCDSLM